MSSKLIKRAVLAIALTTAFAHADEGRVQEAVEAFIGAPAVETVRKTAYGELYEVVLKSGELVYTDAAVSFIVDGRIIDTGTRRDVTQERRAELSAIDFSDLPLDQAIKQVRGDGTRVVASFEDPNCGYCKRLGHELAALDNLTLYTFLYPVLGADSDAKSRHIWCAKDQAKAWNDWILDGVRPQEAKCDTSAVDANIALGRQLKVEGTPTLFFADGRRVGGFLRAEQLEQVFSSQQ